MHIFVGVSLFGGILFFLKIIYINLQKKINLKFYKKNNNGNKFNILLFNLNKKNKIHFKLFIYKIDIMSIFRKNTTNDFTLNVKQIKHPKFSFSIRIENIHDSFEHSLFYPSNDQFTNEISILCFNSCNSCNDIQPYKAYQKYQCIFEKLFKSPKLVITKHQCNLEVELLQRVTDICTSKFKLDISSLNIKDTNDENYTLTVLQIVNIYFHIFCLTNEYDEKINNNNFLKKMATDFKFYI